MGGVGAIGQNCGMKQVWQGWLLGGILLLGLWLRFWNLDAKPIWLDEVITALFSSGRSYDAVPLGTVLPLSALDQVFTHQPTHCANIVEAVSTQSVHPPLFFCWMHSWLSWVSGLPQSWLWKLRAFSALLGVVAIAALYQLNRVLFSRSAALVGAALMAVSPFAVYLSQEARHYTLPIVLVILALLGLYQILTDLHQQQRRPALWLGWIAVNSIGFYVHYFFLLSFAAQVATLLVCAQNSKLKITPSESLREQNSKLKISLAAADLLSIALAITAVCLTYLPWLPTLLAHLSRPETDWLQRNGSGWSQAIAPLYQLPISWILMVISLPVERQPEWLEILSGLIMISFTGWLLWRVAGRLRRLWTLPETRLATQMLGIYVLVVLLEFLAIVYILDKDITQVPRYSFIYFPAVIALLGASLSLKERDRSIPKLWLQGHETRSRQFRQRIGGGHQKLQQHKRSGLRTIAIVLLAGVISSVLVVSDLTFDKPYSPDQVARNLTIDPELPHLVSVAYADLQDVALGLSFAWALHEQADQAKSKQTEFVFLPRSKKSRSYKPVWKTLANLEHSLSYPLNLWVIGPGLRRKQFPENLALSINTERAKNCTIDPKHYHRRGIPYQLYRCRS